MPDSPADTTSGAQGRPRPDAAEIVIAPRTVVTFVAILAGAALLIAMAYGLRQILAQLLAAIILAMALEPLVQVFVRRGMARGRAVSVTFALGSLAGLGCALMLLPPIIREVGSFSRHLPDLLQKLASEYQQLGRLDQHFNVIEKIRNWLTEEGGAASIGQPALQFVQGMFSTGAAVAAVSFFSLFVALDGPQWFDGFLKLVPDPSRARWQRIGSGVSKAVSGYVSGNVLISVIAATVTTIVLLATGVPYAVPIGLVVGVLDLLPMAGALLGAIIAGAVALTKGIPTMVIVVVVMALYQEFENRTLTQVVYHRTVKLSSLAIAVSLAIGAEIGGVVGALLAIPIAGAIKVVGRELLAWRRGEVPVEVVTPPKRRSWLPRAWKR
jgi:predicted PurR-regulated permease PerM